MSDDGNNRRPRVDPFFTVPKQAVNTIAERIDGTDVAFAVAVYVALRCLANDLRTAAGPFSAGIADIARRAGCSYRKAAEMLSVLFSIGVIGVEKQRIAGTKSHAPSVYSFPPIGGSVRHNMPNTLDTERGPIRAEIDKEQKQSKEPYAPAGAAERTRDVLFDALATAEGSNLNELTRRNARAIGVALAEIRRATPAVTPDEIAARARGYRRLYPGAACTANALANHWGKLSENTSAKQEASVAIPEPAGWRPFLNRELPDSPLATGNERGDEPWHRIDRASQDQIIKLMDQATAGGTG